MKYIIYNDKIIENRNTRDKVREVIKNQMQRIDKVAENYSKPLCAEIHFNKINNEEFLVSCNIRLKEGVVFLKNSGAEPSPL